MKWTSTQQALVWRFLTLSLALLYSFSFAQNISITAPESKEVSPGDFVTLVFQLSSLTTQTVTISATSNLDWQILRQPGEVSLNKNQTKRVAVTVAIPNNAKAGIQSKVNLEIKHPEGIQESEVTLELIAFQKLALFHKSELILGQEVLGIRMLNEGNIDKTLTLNIRQSSSFSLEEKFTIPAFESQTFSFEASFEGLHIVELKSGEDVLATSVFRVIKFGLPEPESLLLEGSIKAVLDNKGNWSNHLFLEGPTSDYLRLEASLNAPAWQTSYLEVESKNLQARAGKSFSNPFGLQLRSGFGLSGFWVPGKNKTLASSLSWLKDDAFSFFIAGQYKDPYTLMAAGTALTDGDIYSENKLLFRFDSTVLQSRFSLLANTLNADFKADFISDTRQYEFELSAEGLFSENTKVLGLFGFSQNDLGTLMAGFNSSINDFNNTNAYVSLNGAIPSSLPGQLSAQFQAGLNTSFLTLRYSGEIEAGWSTSNQFSIQFNQEDYYISLNSFWAETIYDELSLNADLRLYPETGLFESSLELNSLIRLDPWPFDILATSSWSSADENLSVEASLDWQESKDWQVSLSNRLSYAYGTSSDWSYSLNLEAEYNFLTAVPSELTEATGGRRLGKLIGKVEANGLALANVEIQVERYRVLTNEQGMFSADLPPGEYEIALSTTSLPITYRLLGLNEVKAVVEIDKETEVLFEVIETAVIQGRVLEDSDGDGQADNNAKGVRAQFILTDAEGLRRSVLSQDDGFFSIRGLIPGLSNLKLSSVATGSVVVGSQEQTVTLESGKITELVFLVQPALARSQSFESKSIRVRRINAQADNVKAGSSPVISVTLSDEVDMVYLESEFGRHELALVDGLWQGRLGIPDTAPEGVFEYTVFAKKGTTETSKSARLFIDSLAPAYDLRVNGPVKAGEELSISLSSLFYPITLTIESEFGNARVQETGSNSYEAYLMIPETAIDAVYTLNISIQTETEVFTEESTFRVLAP